MVVKAPVLRGCFGEFRFMLISFSVENFRSFGEEMTLNMVASNKIANHVSHLVPIGDTGKSVLRSAMIYGANAAGKSNFVKAIGLAQKLILERSGNLPHVTPFYFNPALYLKPTTFEFRIMIDGRVYIYGFDFFRGQFTQEWLSFVKGIEEVTIFERGADGKTLVFHDALRQLEADDTYTTLEKLRGLAMRPDQLFLNRAIGIPEESRGVLLGAIVKWFVDDLLVIPINTRDCNLVSRLHGDEKFRNFCSTFLSNVGTGVGGLHVLEQTREATEHELKYIPQLGSDGFRQIFGGCEDDKDICLNPDDPKKVIERQLVAHHKVPAAAYGLPFSEESDGTIAMLHLMPVLSSGGHPTLSHTGRVVVIDELDRSIHPNLCYEFIRFYSESCPGSWRQLIVTTHEVQLLDQALLRRDEYWFVEKDEHQQTQLYSLSDFNIRNDLRLSKGYIEGRFGAIPAIGGMEQLSALLSCDGEEERSECHANSAP